MNYTRQGIKNRLKMMNSHSEKIKRTILVLLLKVFLVGVLAVGIFGISAGFGVFNGIVEPVNEMDISLDDLMPNGYATMVYDAEGNQIQKLVAESANRTYVQSEMIPKHLKDAFVAIEDERYYEHNGVDIKSILRAVFIGISNGFRFSQGGSTITQQLLKNNVFTDWMSEDSFADRLTRKLQEQVLAIRVSEMYDKDTLLTLYLNTINLGANTLGVQAASLRYFNKGVQELSLSESAVLAGITQNPYKFNPIIHPEENRERRKEVLNKMLKFGFCTQAEYDEAINDDVYARITQVNETVATKSVNSYFVDELTEQLMDDLMNKRGMSYDAAYRLLYMSGCKIYTTMDPKIQAICDEILADESNYPSNSKWYLSEFAVTVKKADGSQANYSVQMLNSYFKEKNKKYNRIYTTTDAAYADIAEYEASILEEGDEISDEKISLVPQPQVSLTIQDQHTGYVVAMVGGRGEKTASQTLNRASNTKRQPGSTFKILSAYAPALDSSGMTLATVQTDAPFKYYDGTPVSNWWDGGTYKGICSLRYAIEQSLNIIAVKTLTIITPELGFAYVQNFGISTVVEKAYSYGQVLSDVNQSLALGGITYGVTNMELNAAYAAIANGGTYIRPVLYTQLVDADGNVLLDNTKPDQYQVIKPTTAYLLTSAMMDVVNQGTGAITRFDRNMAIAGKTGTTSSNKDFWFAGYTPYYTCTVWGGYDNNVSMNSSEEKSFHKKIWKKVMGAVHADLAPKNFQMPSGIVTCTVCSKSGLLPIDGLCDAHVRVEYFEEGTQPLEYCNVHYAGLICPFDRLPAADTCPFSFAGITEMDPPLDESLLQGSMVLNTDGTIASLPNTTGICSHTAEFFLDPNSINIVQAQFLSLTDDIRYLVQLSHPDIWGAPANTAPAEGTE